MGFSKVDGPPYICPECKRKFITYEAANGHLVAHSENAPWKSAAD